MAWLAPDTAAWVQHEFQDYIAPKDWKTKGDKKGVALSKKKGTEESDTPYYKVESLFKGVPPERVVDVVHTRAIENAAALDKNTEKVTVLEKLSGAQLGGIADEAVVYHRLAKLPFVDNRDFVTVTFLKTLENPVTKRKVIAMFTRSADNHPGAPPPGSLKGYTRATVMRACAFLEERPEGTYYTTTNQVDVHMKLSKAAHKGTKGYMKEHIDILKKLTGAQ